MNQVADALQKTRNLISQPGTWIINEAHQIGPAGQHQFCVHGAMSTASRYLMIGVPIRLLHAACYNVLKRRWLAGVLPEPKFSGGGRPPVAWVTLFTNPFYQKAQAVVQFNNSTSQAEVLQLLDEAIAEAEASGRPPQPAPDEAPIGEPPPPEEPTPEPDEPEDEPTARVLELA